MVILGVLLLMINLGVSLLMVMLCVCVRRFTVDGYTGVSLLTVLLVFHC